MSELTFWGQGGERTIAINIKNQIIPCPRTKSAVGKVKCRLREESSAVGVGVGRHVFY